MYDAPSLIRPPPFAYGEGWGTRTFRSGDALVTFLSQTEVEDFLPDEIAVDIRSIQ